MDPPKASSGIASCLFSILGCRMPKQEDQEYKKCFAMVWDNWDTRILKQEQNNKILLIVKIKEEQKSYKHIVFLKKKERQFLLQILGLMSDQQTPESRVKKTNKNSEIVWELNEDRLR